MARKDIQQYKLPLSHRICENFNLPEDTCRNCSHIEITSNCCAMVDGCKGVLEYDDETIKLNLGKNSVSFNGNSLTIRSLTNEQAIIEGLIVSIEFSN